MTDTLKSLEPTDPTREVELGGVALWLEVEDLRGGFGANAVLHKAGLEAVTDSGTEA